jgi:hypothetical protein
MHLHSMAEDLVLHIQEMIQKSTDENQKQALQDVLPQAEYLATRLKEIGSA